jgi:hemoglobin-like flavoprotein
MPLDAARSARMHDMLVRLRRDHPEAAEDFYHLLFERAPELRVLFRAEDMEGQGMRFMTALSVLVERLDRPGEMAAELRELGRGHSAYGVKAQHYPPMREALLDTMRAKLGAEFDEDAAAEWAALYDRAAAEMIAAARA